MGDRRKTRGPTYGRTKLSRPVVVRPGTLRAGILAGRLHFFSLAQGHLTSRTQCRPPQDSRATCIRRAASSGGLLATSFGGLHPFTGLSTHPEDTKLSTNKQHSLSWAPGQRRAVRCTTWVFATCIWQSTSKPSSSLQDAMPWPQNSGWRAGRQVQRSAWAWP